MKKPKELLKEYLKGITDIQKKIDTKHPDWEEIEQQRLNYTSSIRCIEALENSIDLKNLDRIPDEFKKLTSKLNYQKLKNKRLEKKLFKIKFKGVKTLPSNYKQLI